jgi:membrane fusion protein (multidrug efflux system)
VRLCATRGDFVAIREGVKAGQELVTAGAFKLRNGSGVMVNNEIKPTPALAPHVENL